MDTQTCFKCKRELPPEEFYKNQKDCKSCQKEYRKHYYQKNKARYRELGKKFQEENREKCRQYTKDHYYRNQEERQSKMRMKYHERQAMKKEQDYDADITREGLMWRDKGICGICKKPVAWGDDSIDHIIPVSRGGPHKWDNVQLAHLKCNISKGDREQ